MTTPTLAPMPPVEIVESDVPAVMGILHLPSDDNVHVLVQDADGNTISEETVHNKLVASGRDLIRDMLFGVSGGPDWIAVGKTGAFPVLDTDTQLGLEYYRGRVTKRISSTGKATFKLHLTTAEANLFEGDPGPPPIPAEYIQEIGVFVGARYGADGIPLGGGRLFARAMITPIQKNPRIQVTITWDFPIESA